MFSEYTPLILVTGNLYFNTSLPVQTQDSNFKLIF